MTTPRSRRESPPSITGSLPAALLATVIDRCSNCDALIHQGGLAQVVSPTALACERCAGLAGLEVLPSGDVAMTRRTQRLSSRVAALIEWSPKAKRWERRGTLAEPAAIIEARRLCASDADARERARIAAVGRREIEQRDYLRSFRAAILRLFPGCPRAEAAEIAVHACEKHSGRVGRTAAAKALDDEMVRLAVVAHVRHLHTTYDQTIARTRDKRGSRAVIRADVQAVLTAWQGGEAAPAARN